ncbi:MAG: UDP-N-acetylmuramate--L-alanine ligase [Acidimicrobiia bacterium]
MSEIPMLDLSTRRRLHVVGAGGAGMSALAVILAQMGHDVSGSESAQLPILERLRDAGVRINLIQDGSVITSDIDAVITSTAVPSDNAELQAAHHCGVAVLHRSVAQAAMLRGRASVAIAGSHGKTTTTAMLAHILKVLDPSSSAFMGADLNGGTNGWFNGGQRFVMEADESDGTFRLLSPQIGVITNIEPDHLEHHADFDHLVASFEAFAEENIQQLAILNGDDQRCRAIAQRRGDGTVCVGHSDQCTWQIIEERCAPEASTALVRTPEGELHVAVPVPGAHNIMNATMALAAGNALELEMDAMRDALTTYPGVARRFTRRDRDDGVIVVDDYAHLPTEVTVTLDAARRLGPGPLIAVFQPHRYSRTQTLARDFQDCFGDANHVIITAI